MITPVLLKLDAIRKVYPGVVANRDISLEVAVGEVHALLGENGAGKSTLMNILYGLTQPDSGQLLWEGHPVRIGSPRDAIRLGIGMVHQQFMLIPTFTALENIVLQTAGTIRKPGLATHAARQSVIRLCAEYHLTLDLDQPTGTMTLAIQQRVEIVRVLYQGARLLILDEPGAVLTPSEVAELFTILRQLCAAGHAVILITHKLDEVMVVSQRVSILRSGQHIATLNTAETSPEALARLMIGRDLGRSAPRLPVDVLRPPAIRVEALCVLPSADHDALDNVSLKVAPGEILGVAGVEGSGQYALWESLCGLRKVTSGAIWLLGRETTHFSPRQLDARNIGRIPGDRQTLGLLNGLSVRDNLLMQRSDRPPLADHGWLRPARIAAFSRDLIHTYDIRPANLNLSIQKLSGGNQQKVILARALANRPSILIVANPTRGLDIGAASAIHRHLLEQRQRGAAILLISNDLDEIVTLSNRIVVMNGGQIVDTLPAAEANSQRIGLLMGGQGQPPGLSTP